MKNPSKKGCIQCGVPHATGGSPRLLATHRIVPDLGMVHRFLNYSIWKCHQCGRYQLFNGKVFEPLLKDQIPSVLEWEQTPGLVQRFKSAFAQITMHKISGGFYGALCDLKTKASGSYAQSLVILSEWPLSGPHWTKIRLPSEVTDIQASTWIQSDSNWWDAGQHLPKYVFRKASKSTLGHADSIGK